MGATKNSYSSPLELTIISAESLTMPGNRSIKKNTFVVVRTESNKEFATKLDPENGSWPYWGDKFFIDMPMHVNYFTLEVHYKSSNSTYVVGSVRVPTSDFMGRYFPNNYLHFLSYRLKDRNGDRNGIINISIKVKSSLDCNNAGSSSSKSSLMPTSWNYGVGKTMNQGVSNGIVMGVPLGKQC